MFDMQAYLQAVNALKSTKQRVFTNSFLSAEELKGISELERSILVRLDHAVCLLWPEDTYTRLQYHASSMEEYAAIRREIAESGLGYPCIADLVGKDAQVLPQVQAMEKVGFVRHARYSRWRTANVDRTFQEYAQAENVRCAKEEDAEEISQIISDEFDHYTSHLPDVDTIRETCRQGLVVCSRIEGKIVGVMGSQDLGTKAKYLNYIAIKDAYKNSGLGIALHESTFDLFPSDTVYTSWTNDNNRKINRINTHYGFVRDGLVDYIMKDEGVHSNEK